MLSHRDKEGKRFSRGLRVISAEGKMSGLLQKMLWTEASGTHTGTEGRKKQISDNSGSKG